MCAILGLPVHGDEGFQHSGNGQNQCMRMIGAICGLLSIARMCDRGGGATHTVRTCRVYEQVINVHVIAKCVRVVAIVICLISSACLLYTVRLTYLKEAVVQIGSFCIISLGLLTSIKCLISFLVRSIQAELRIFPLYDRKVHVYRRFKRTLNPWLAVALFINCSGPGLCPLTCGPSGVGRPGLHYCSTGSGNPTLVHFVAPLPHRSNLECRSAPGKVDSEEGGTSQQEKK